MGNRTLTKLIYPLLRTYWFIFRPKTRGVKCVIQSGNEVLMIRNTYGHILWTFPGGGIDKGEASIDAARREVMEEVGIEVKNVRKIGEFVTTAEYKRDAVEVFAGESVGKWFRIDPKEILEAKWFELNRLPEISEYAKRVISMLGR